MSDAEIASTASDVLREGARSFWADDGDARLDKFAGVMRSVDADSRARLVREMLQQDPGALFSWMQGSTLNQLTSDGRVTSSERQAIAEGVAGAYNNGALSFTQVQSFLGVNTQFAPALAQEQFQGARALATGSGPVFTAFRERFVRDSFAMSAQRSANGLGMGGMESAFAVTLAADAGEQASIARAFGALDPAAQRAVASDIGQAAIGYRNSRAAISGLADPLATLTQAVRAGAPAGTESGRLALTRIAEGLAGNRDGALQAGATALYREIADARAQQPGTQPDARARALGRVADAEAGAAQVLARLPASATAEQVWAVVQSNPAAVVAPTFTQYLELRGDGARSLQGAALRNDIGLAMGLQPDRAPQSLLEQADFDAGRFDYFGGDAARAVRAVEAKVGEAGGPGARVAALPVTVASKELGLVQVPLFRVEGADGREHYVDYNPATGEARTYGDFADWRANNQLPPGQMTFAANGHLTAGADGKPQLVTANTPGTPDTFWERWGQPALDGAALVGGVVLLGAAVVGTGGTALLVGGALLGAYGATRGGAVLVDRATHGQSVDPLQNAEARNAWLNVGAGVTGFAAAGSSLRLAAAAGRVSGLDDAANLARLATTSRTLNVAAQYADTSAMIDTGYSLAANWDRLTPQQRVAALAQMAFWSGGTAVAARQAGGLTNLYGVGDMARALGQSNAWLRSQLPTGTQLKQVLAQAADGFRLAPGERVVEVVTPDGLRMKMVVEPQHDNTVRMQASGTGGAHTARLVGPAELAAWRARLPIAPDQQTLAVGRTDIAQLSGSTFEGASRAVRRAAGLPQAEAGPVTSPNANPLFREHAEEDIANQFVAAVRAAGLRPADLNHRTLDILISNPTGVCNICRQGLANPDVPPGVLKQLSELYPALTIRVTVQTQAGVVPQGGSEIIIRGGARVN